MEGKNWVLTGKDLEKLRMVQHAISENTACSYDKAECLQHLDSILNPKCVMCRKPLEGDVVVINEKKMHEKCSKKYKG